MLFWTQKNTYCTGEIYRMIMRIGTAFPALWMENELKNHLIRIAIEEDCELDLADYRGGMKKLWNAFPDLDLAFLIMLFCVNIRKFCLDFSAGIRIV